MSSLVASRRARVAIPRARARCVARARRSGRLGRLLALASSDRRRRFRTRSTPRASPRRRATRPGRSGRAPPRAIDSPRDVHPRAADGDSTELSDGVTLDRALELSSVVKFAVPLLATNIVTPLLTMTDTAFVGRCAVDSVVQLAALGVSTPLTDYTVTLAAFIPAGLTNIISAGVARWASPASPRRETTARSSSPSRSRSASSPSSSSFPNRSSRGSRPLPR